MTGRRAIATGLTLAAVAVAMSCRDPTEIELEAHTNVAWHMGIDTSFTVGTPGETESAFSTTETREPWGADGFVGSLVVVPGSAKDAPLSVKLVMGVTRDPHDCSIAQPDGCIFARRMLSYVPHRALHLPIELYAQCEGVPCDASTTCNFLGQCVSAAIDPSTCDSDTGCAPPGDKPPADGGAIPPAPVDAGGDDASLDAPADSRPESSTPILDGGGDAGAMGDIACGNGTCHAGSYCCWDSVGKTGNCQPNGTSCTPGRLAIQCDGPEDCATGQCCGVSNASQCAPMGAACLDGEELCHSNAECGPMGCTMNGFGAAYGICASGGGM